MIVYICCLIIGLALPFSCGIICHEKLPHAARAHYHTCDNGFCRFRMHENIISQDCIQGFKNVQLGCRQEIGNNNGPTSNQRSIICFCNKNYCNSEFNVSNSLDVKQFLSYTCHKYSIGSRNRTIGACSGSLCYVGMNLRTKFLYGDCFRGVQRWMTKYEGIYQVWPYGKKLSSNECFTVESGNHVAVTCLCSGTYCNVPDVIRVPQAKKAVTCKMVTRYDQTKSCIGDHCLLVRTSALGNYYYQCLNLSSSMTLNTGEMRAIEYKMWVCDEDWCNYNVTVARRSLNLNF